MNVAGGAGRGFVNMTDHAGSLPGVSDGMLPDQRKGTGAIVAVLSKGLGDNSAAHHQKDSQTGQQNQGRTNQVTCIPHQTPQCSLFRANRLVAQGRSGG